MLRMRKNLFCPAAFYYKTFPHNIDPICDMLCQPKVMGHKQHPTGCWFAISRLDGL